jgi:hypothetical protein
VGSLLLLCAHAASAQSAVEATLPDQVSPEATFVERISRNDLPVGQLKAFGDINYWQQTDSRPSHGRRDRVEQPQISFEYRFAPSVALTFGGNYTHLDGAKFDPVGAYRLDGVAGFAGMTFYFMNYYNINVTGGGLTSRIYETRPSGSAAGFAYTNKTNNGVFGSVTLNANYSFNKFRINPFVNVLYYTGVESAGLESDGYYRLANPDYLGRLSVGSEFYYRVEFSGVAIEPMFRAAFIYDYKLLNDWYDRTALELATGFNAPINDKLTLAFRVGTTIGRDYYQWTGVKGSFYYRF